MVSHVRLSQRRAYGPLIPLGVCHVVIGFEPLEVYRIFRDYGHDGVRVIMNDRPFYPLDVLQQRNRYPDMDDLISRVRLLATDLKIIRGTELAKEAGHPQAQNVVMVGAFAGLGWVPLKKERFLEAIEETFSGAKLELNKKAFELGYHAALES